MSKRRLLFKNPVFNPGINVTVRKGVRWYGQVAPESVVEIGTPVGGHLFDAFILDCQKMKICDIPLSVLSLEHDPICRTHAGLLAVLEQTYGRKFTGRDMVTVITFEQCDPDPGEADDPIEPPRIH